MNELNVYFSDFFNVSEDTIEAYGAVNISLINDMPLFIDPFLLFNSSKPEYQKIHNDIISYLLFLQEQAEHYPTLQPGMLSLWYTFSEVKQTWLGFSLSGNSGRGLGKDFATNLHTNLQSIFKDFGKETVTQSSHFEKLCLISPLVGRDKISDFATNFAKQYLLEYTSTFATTHLTPEQCKEFTITKVHFNFETHTWQSAKYVLPSYNNDYILLTPCDMLTRDQTFINRKDMIDRLPYLASSVEDATLRFALNQYLTDVLPRKKEEMTRAEKDHAASLLIAEHSDIIDFYIKYKEDNQGFATSLSEQVVSEVKQIFNCQLKELINNLHDKTDFYSSDTTCYEDAYQRILFLKAVIEDMDGYRLFYLKGKPISRENDLQIMYRLIWYATDKDINREVNNGRGPVDFKVSKGAVDTVLIEFKLASNSKLKQNLKNQVKIYEKANGTTQSIKVIFYFTDQEQSKVNAILNELGLQNCKDVILIDVRDQKPSASNVR